LVSTQVPLHIWTLVWPVVLQQPLEQLWPVMQRVAQLPQ
jgi:hypothetical protein